MPIYDVYIHCEDCGGNHPLRISVHVENGPESKKSVAEFVRGHTLPPQVAVIRGRAAFCYKTGNKFYLQNDEEIFLVPLLSKKTGRANPKTPQYRMGGD